MAKDANDTAAAQNDLILAAVRQDALNALVKEGHGSAYTSEAHQTKKGLQVTTTNDRTHARSSLVINGEADHHRTTFGFGWQMTGNFTIDHLDGKPAEHDQFVGITKNLDRDDMANISMSRKDASGGNIQTYEPAISEETSRLDPNGFHVRIAKPAGSDANIQADNIANPGNHRKESEFIIHDKDLGDLSYNETGETKPAYYAYRSVVRDMKGNVLGIVTQDFHLDKDGNLTDVKTEARLPGQVK